MEENLISVFLKEGFSMIDRVGDCPNPDRAVFEGDVFDWQKVKENSKFILEENAITGVNRILTSERVQKAWGSKEAMQEKYRRLSRKSFLQAGDVIGISRKNLYNHYAIYLGNDQVIHYAADHGDFNGTITIHQAPLADFLKQDNNYFVLHFTQQGKCVKLHAKTKFSVMDASLGDLLEKINTMDYHLYSPKQTIERAKSRLGEQKYSLFANNCEHFAIWCKTGVSESLQVNSATKVLPLLEEKP